MTAPRLFDNETRMGRKWTRGYAIMDHGDCIEITEVDASGRNVNGSGLRMPKDQGDIERIARELRRYLAGPLGQMAIDAEASDDALVGQSATCGNAEARNGGVC